MSFKDLIQKRLYEAAYRREHPEIMRRIHAAFYQRHRLKILAQQKAHMSQPAQKAARRIYLETYNEEHKAEKKAYDAARYEAKRTEKLAQVAGYKEENPKKVRDININYYKNNREKFYQHAQARRARKKEAAVVDLSRAQWEEIKAAYGNRCVYCGRKMRKLSQDHIIPLSKGGDHTVSNIVPACLTCNLKKGNRAPLVPVQPLLLTLAPPRVA